MESLEVDRKKIFLDVVLKDLQSNTNSKFNFEEDNTFVVTDKDSSNCSIMVRIDESSIQVKEIISGMFEFLCDDKKVIIGNQNGDVKGIVTIIDKDNYYFSYTSLEYVEYFNCCHGEFYHAMYKKEYIERKKEGSSKFDSSSERVYDMVSIMFGNLIMQFPNLINYIMNNVNLGQEVKEKIGTLVKKK